MTDRSTSPGTAGQSWGEHYLCTIAEQSVRIATALERIAELAEQAAAHEGLLFPDRTDAEVKEILRQRNPPTPSRSDRTPPR